MGKRRNIDDLSIYIVDINDYTCDVFKKYFQDINNVNIIKSDIVQFYNEQKNIDCLVSPANAFGRMTGGYDAALSDILGWDFQKKVQKYIQEHFYGEQGVGTSFIIETDNPGVKLIHTPTMRYPSKIIDNMIVYYCMRSTLICALENDVNVIVIPVFGGSCGGVKAEIAAQNMKDAYMQIKERCGADHNF